MAANAVNTPWRPAFALAALAAATLARPTPTQGAQVTVLASTAVAATLRTLAPQFERATSDQLAVRYDTTSALKTEIENGASFDVVILTAAAIESLTGTGKVVSDSSSALARSGIGVVVRAAAPKPNIATADAFKAALLAARSVAFTASGASGIYFEALLQRLGLADVVNAKALRPEGGTVGELVARGEAELGVQQISELLPVPGIDYVGPLPPEYQNYTVFTASLGAHAEHANAGKALIAFLLTPAARQLFSANGLEPP